MELGKIGKYYTNYGRHNHNVNTWRVKKKEESIVAITKVTTHNQKVQKTISYACPICGLNGHKMANCPKFVRCKKCSKAKMHQIQMENR
jgi:hypothetical protein